MSCAYTIIGGHKYNSYADITSTSTSISKFIDGHKCYFNAEVTSTLQHCYTTDQ